MIKKILTFLASIYCSALLLNYTEKYITAGEKIDADAINITLDNKILSEINADGNEAMETCVNATLFTVSFILYCFYDYCPVIICTPDINRNTHIHKIRPAFYIFVTV